MPCPRLPGTTALLLGLAASLPAQADPAASAWPGYRGRQARGLSEGPTLPTTWSVESGANIRFKTPIPGLSHSSPVIWGDKIFLTTAASKNKAKAELKVGLYGSIQPVANEGPQLMQVLCLDRNTGKILWTRTAWEGIPQIQRHPKGSHAASSPAVDATHVAVFFGSEGLYVYDHDGKLLWKKDLGRMDSGFFRVKDAQWGFASSPVIHEDRLYMQCDVQDQSFVAAFDLQDGKELWRTKREEVPTWGCPTVAIQKGRRQLILNGWKHIGGYDLDSGKELWRLEGGGDIPVPTPVVAHDLVFITNAHGRYAPILAIDLAAEGSFTMDADKSSQMRWSIPRGGNYMQTPIVVAELLYACKDQGILSCFDAKTGKRHYRKRLGPGGTGFTASPVADKEKLYFTSEEGEVYVIRAGTTFEELAVNKLGETCMATPAISRGALYFRTRSHLIAVAAGEKGSDDKPTKRKPPAALPVKKS